MKEKIGVILASAMFVAGCDTVHSTGTEAPAGPPKVDTHAVADVLPGAVAEQLSNVIAIKKMSHIALGYIENSYTGICSGVRVGANDYLSAGHCDEDPATKYGYASPCIDTTVAIASGGQELPVNAESDFYNPHYDQNDTMLLHSTNSGPAYGTPVHYADSNYVAPGTQLYVVSFEPTASGELRSPASGDKPVVIGAIALGTRPNGQIEAVEGIKSYTSDGETVIRQGASGGPVFDGNGNLVGVIRGESTLDGHPSIVQNYESNDNVVITDLPADAPIDVMVLQPVSADIVANHRSSLHAPTVPTC